jgi:hypothetical protein
LLREGKNREIKKLLEALELSVSSLKRTHYGPYSLGTLESGASLEVGLLGSDLSRLFAYKVHRPPYTDYIEPFYDDLLHESKLQDWTRKTAAKASKK